MTKTKGRLVHDAPIVPYLPVQGRSLKKKKAENKGELLRFIPLQYQLQTFSSRVTNTYKKAKLLCLSISYVNVMFLWREFKYLWNLRTWSDDDNNTNVSSMNLL